MAKNTDLFVERRDQGDYAVRRASSERASATAPTQAAAIKKAHELDSEATVMIERVRHRKHGPDKWRTE